MTINTFSQLRPFTIGYEDIFDHFENLMGHNVPNYPPYNIIKTGDYTHNIEVALAGYSKDMIEVIVEDKNLTIKSADLLADKDMNKGVVHKGIAMRAFTRHFSLAEDVEVKGAELKNGLLRVSLERVVPEEKKPKTIKIK
tara:strand:+ start:62 stop:481 length:420 start_codon:yes stop_codon:yes gene_type:complete